MYSTKTATTNNQEFNGSYMPVGINDNITLKEVNVMKSPQGRDYLEFVFENEQGQTVSFTEWKNELNTWIKNADDLQKRDDQQFGRILQVVKCFKEEPDFEGSSFAEMINWVKTTLTTIGEWDKQPLRIKVVYDKKGYTTVSRNGIYVEPMCVEQSQIKLWKNDLLERPVQPDKEDDPLGTTTAPVTETKTGADDLPF
jgi:hypothetical protein